MQSSLYLAAILLGAAPLQEVSSLPDDPQFPIIALFGETRVRRDWAVRFDEGALVVLGGPASDWFVTWDLLSGRIKTQARAPQAPTTVVHREMGPTGKYYFHVPAPEVDKIGRRTQIVRYYDTTSGALAKTASFSNLSPPRFKLPGTTADERYLLGAFGGGQHPKDEALRTFVGKMYKNQGLLNRLVTPDGLFVTGMDPAHKLFTVVDAEQARLVAELDLPLHLQFENGPFATLSEDRSTLALTAIGKDMIHIADLAKRKFVRELSGHPGGAVAGFKLSSDGGRLLSSGASDQKARLWDTRQGKELATLAVRGVSEVGFLSPGAKAGVVVEDHRVRLLNPDGTHLRTMSTAFAWKTRLSGDGKFALNIHDDTVSSSLAFWSLDPVQLLREQELPGGVGFHHLAADGRYAWIRAGTTDFVLDRDQPAPVWKGRIEGRPVGILPGGAILICLRGNALIGLNLETGEPRWSVEFPKAVHAAQLNLRGSHCLALTEASRIVDVSTGSFVEGGPLPWGPEGDLDAHLSDDGQTVVSILRTERAVRWCTAAGQELHRWAYGATFEPRRSWLGASPDVRRAYVYNDYAVGVLTQERGLEKTYVFSKGSPFSAAMFGDFLFVHQGRGSALLRHSTAK